MAKATIQVIDLLRSTAGNLRRSDRYQWGHMGLCNCGFLAQEVTHLRKDEIHARAMLGHGDWNEQLNDFCPTSKLPIDDIIRDLLSVGFDIDDLKHLERLSSPLVLRAIEPEKRNLQRNVKNDVVVYLETWAEVLERKLLSSIDVSRFVTVPNYMEPLWENETEGNLLVHFPGSQTGTIFQDGPPPPVRFSKAR